jgi:hypothetical protein
LTYEIDDIELGYEVYFFVSHFEVVPLGEAFGIYIILEYQVVSVAIYLYWFSFTLKTAIRLADS